MQIFHRCHVAVAILAFLLPLSAAQADPPRSEDRSLSWVVQRGMPFIPKLKLEVVVPEAVIDGTRFVFEADVSVCLNERSRGFGFVEFASRDGDVLQLVPVWGTVDWEARALVLIFTPVVDRPIGPDDLVVAVVQQNTSDPGCLIWDFVGSEVASIALPPPFEVEGTISLSRHGEECEPADYGQLDAWAAIDTPLQEVAPLPPSNIVGFETLIRLNPDQVARGFLDIHLPGETVSYEPIFGAAFPGDDESLVRTIVVLLLADRQAPLNTNDHVLRANVAVERGNPDCQIWDLINGTSGQVNGMFEALGAIRVWPSTATVAGIRHEQLNNKYPENMPRGR